MYYRLDIIALVISDEIPNLKLNFKVRYQTKFIL